MHMIVVKSIFGRRFLKYHSRRIVIALLIIIIIIFIFLINYYINLQISRQLVQDSLSGFLSLNEFSNSNESGKKLLIIEVQHGLSNRLRALASAMSISDQINRELKIIWIPNKHCEARMSDLFILNENTKIKLFNVWEDETHSPYNSGLLSKTEYDIYNYMPTEEGSYKDQLINFNSDKHVYVKSAYRLNHPFGLKGSDLTKALNSLNIHPIVQDYIQSVHIDNSDIGIHIRHQDPKIEINIQSSAYTSSTWDTLTAARSLSSLEIYRKIIDNLLEKNPNQQFYVSTDTKEYIEILQQLYPYPIVKTLSRNNCFDRRKECLQRDLADQILVGSTSIIYGSYWSSYSEVAGLWKGKKVLYPSVDFAVEKKD